MDSSIQTADMNDGGDGTTATAAVGTTTDPGTGGSPVAGGGSHRHHRRRRRKQSQQQQSQSLSQQPADMSDTSRNVGVDDPATCGGGGMVMMDRLQNQAQSVRGSQMVKKKSLNCFPISLCHDDYFFCLKLVKKSFC